jgi:hypothetical protein
MTNNQYNVALKSYNEASALDQLYKAANAAVDHQLDRFENNDFALDQFTITIGGIQTAFIFGSPQYDALVSFIEHIAAENGYAVDYDNCAVTED